jgi:hypothetical protein
MLRQTFRVQVGIALPTDLQFSNVLTVSTAVFIKLSSLTELDSLVEILRIIGFSGLGYVLLDGQVKNGD